jgi:hypothetical protein
MSPKAARIVNETLAQITRVPGSACAIVPVASPVATTQVGSTTEKAVAQPRTTHHRAKQVMPLIFDQRVPITTGDEAALVQLCVFEVTSTTNTKGKGLICRAAARRYLAKCSQNQLLDEGDQAYDWGEGLPPLRNTTQQQALRSHPNDSCLLLQWRWHLLNVVDN